MKALTSHCNPICELNDLNFDDFFAFVARPASGTLGKLCAGEVFIDLVADPADHKILPPLIFPAPAKHLGGEPGKKDGTENNHQVNSNYSIQRNSKHITVRLGGVLK